MILPNLIHEVSPLLPESLRQNHHFPDLMSRMSFPASESLRVWPASPGNNAGFHEIPIFQEFSRQGSIDPPILFCCQRGWLGVPVVQGPMPQSSRRDLHQRRQKFFGLMLVRIQARSLYLPVDWLNNWRSASRKYDPDRPGYRQCMYWFPQDDLLLLWGQNPHLPKKAWPWKPCQPSHLWANPQQHKDHWYGWRWSRESSDAALIFR